VWYVEILWMGVESLVMGRSLGDIQQYLIMILLELAIDDVRMFMSVRCCRGVDV
jgi:hypothetical protein